MPVDIEYRVDGGKKKCRYGYGCLGIARKDRWNRKVRGK